MFLDQRYWHGYDYRYFCFLCSRAQSSHKTYILKQNNYSCAYFWTLLLTTKSWKKPTGIWKGHWFLTVITQVLQEDIKREHIRHFCGLTGTKSYIICQESLRHLLGLICSRLHLRVTSQFTGLLDLPVKTRFSASCKMSNASWSNQ